VKFLVDNQLPAALARWLVSRQVECKHVQDLGLAKATDAEIWDYAHQNSYIVISKDEDFLFLLASEWTIAPEAGEPPPQARLIWIRIGNCRTKVLLETVQRLWSDIEAQLKAGERFVELR
jgi:predicted nuclease of predicted toxin-antitoxin system